VFFIYYLSIVLTLSLSFEATLILCPFSSLVKPEKSSLITILEIMRLPGGEHTVYSRHGYRDLHLRVVARKYKEDGEEWTADWTQLLRVRVLGVSTREH
jgi:hypothetical protein